MELAGEQMGPLKLDAAEGGGGTRGLCLRGESAGEAQAGMLSPANSRSQGKKNALIISSL